MYQPPIVNFPVFSVAWASTTNEEGKTSPAVAAVGGGGAGKTGVGNKISLITIKGGSEPLSHVIERELETSPDTSNCVTANESGQLVAAAFGKSSRIYANAPSGLHKLAEFEVDEATKDSGINSMAFANSKGDSGELLATGGEDGSLRVWQLSASEDVKESDEGEEGEATADGDAKPPQTGSLKATMLRVCKGHTKPITCVRFHPTFQRVIVTSSKDGTCRAWNWQLGSQVALLSSSAGLPSSIASGIVMCRSCCFSPKGDQLFAVQSGPRGKAYVTQWKFHLGGTGTSGGGGGGGVLSCSVEPMKAVCVSKYPVTTLSVRVDGQRMAVGNVEGSVIVFTLPGLMKVKEFPAHDLPVTGLSFSPREDGVWSQLGRFDLLAGSADYKITLFESQGSAAKLAIGRCLSLIKALILLIVAVIRQLISTLVTVAPAAGIAVAGILLYQRFKSMQGEEGVFEDVVVEDVGDVVIEDVFEDTIEDVVEAMPVT